MTRLPGIHHDANCVVVQGEASVLLIDAGTSWYQALQIERILGLLSDDLHPEHLLLTSRRYPFSGAAAHFVEQWPALRVHVGEAGVSALEANGFRHAAISAVTAAKARADEMSASVAK